MSANLRNRAEDLVGRLQQAEDIPSDEVSRLLHELRVHQTELELQNQELQSTLYRLDQTRSRYQRLFNEAPVGYLALDDVGVIRTANATMQALVGDLNLIDRPFYTLLSEGMQQSFLARWRRLLDREPERSIDLQLAGEPTTWVRAQFRRQQDLQSGEILAILIDITDERKAEDERRQLEDQLHHAQKMEIVGQLAGGIAHDFNNQLQIISGFSDLLQVHITDSKMLHFIASMHGAIQRSADLIDNLLAFSRKGQQQGAPYRINAILRELRCLLRGSLDPRILLRIRTDPGDPVVFGDASRMQSALLNLAVNARDSMPQGGELLISAETQKRRERWVSTYGSERPPGRYCCIIVRDTGCGMDEATLAHACEPFFTTKERHEGTGLGLAAVYGTIDAVGGDLSISSVPSKGTTISLLLPIDGDCSQEIEDDQRTSTHFVRRARRRGRILVVDDEPALLDLIEQALREDGYRVDCAHDGLEAVQRYRANEGRYDLVIMDMVMPRLDGLQALLQIRESDPTAKVIICTGFDTDQQIQAAQSAGASEVLRKPYGLGDLQLIIDQTIGNEPPSEPQQRPSEAIDAK